MEKNCCNQRKFFLVGAYCKTLLLTSMIHVGVTTSLFTSMIIVTGLHYCSQAWSEQYRYIAAHNHDQYNCITVLFTDIISITALHKCSKAQSVLLCYSSTHRHDQCHCNTLLSTDMKSVSALHVYYCSIMINVIALNYCSQA